MTQYNLTIFYDGQCPVCSQYVRYTRLSNTVSNVSLRNLRDEPARVAEFNAQGLNVDEGMIVLFNNSTYYGSEAMHILALLSTPVGIFNRCNRLIFSHRRLGRILYPFLIAGRNTLLFLLGRKKIKTL